MGNYDKDFRLALKEASKPRKRGLTERRGNWASEMMGLSAKDVPEPRKLADFKFWAEREADRGKRYGSWREAWDAWMTINRMMGESCGKPHGKRTKKRKGRKAMNEAIDAKQLAKLRKYENTDANFDDLDEEIGGPDKIKEGLIDLIEWALEEWLGDAAKGLTASISPADYDYYVDENEPDSSGSMTGISNYNAQAVISMGGVSVMNVTLQGDGVAWAAPDAKEVTFSVDSFTLRIDDVGEDV